MERRLAAVLIADVAGYGRLSQVDEEGTRTRFRSDLREIFEPSISAHHGRLVHTMGDAILVEFHSVVDATRCAVQVQHAKANRDSDVPPDRRLVYRIGINLGDIIVEGDDIQGDGVNIADRVQRLAEAGGIAVSGTAYDQIAHKIEVGFQFLGEQRVKNIAEPVRVYRVLSGSRRAGKQFGDGRAAFRSLPLRAIAASLLLLVAGMTAWWRPWEARVEPASVEHMVLPLPDRPSIAVLPFANMSGDPQQEYFADGITDDLITELSKVSGLFVVSRNSTFRFKGKTAPPKQVSEEFGVRYVLEGSVQRAGERLRINAQLIDALSGGEEWADRFDGSLADVFALQDSVARNIADALAVRLTAAEQQFIGEEETSVPAAYDAFLRGWELFRRENSEDFKKAIPYFEEAIRLDPEYGRAYAALALLYFGSYDAAWTYNLDISYDEARRKGRQYLKEAEKHPTALFHQAAGLISWIDWEPDKAFSEFRKAIELYPGDPLSYAYMGMALTSAGRPREAIPYIRTAMRLDPYYPPVFTHFLGLAQFGLERFEEAAASFEIAARRNPDNEYPFAALAAAYGHLGRKQDARSAIARYDDIWVRRGYVPLTIGEMPSLGFRSDADLQRLRTGLLLAGVPRYGFSDEFATKNELNADEIRALFVGHRLHGRNPWQRVERTVSVTEDGVAALSGDWVLGDRSLTGGTAQFNDDGLCLRFGVESYCGAVFRNPGGLKETENEFIWLRGEAFTFSQVE